MLGPFQYLGKSLDHIQLYRHKPIPYVTMDVINEAGEDWFVAEHDFVYVLSKNEDVVLVRIEKEDRDEE